MTGSEQQLDATMTELAVKQREAREAEALRCQRIEAHWEAVRRGTANVEDYVAARQLVGRLEELMRRPPSVVRALIKPDQEYAARYRVLKMVLFRLGISDPNPFRQLSRFDENHRLAPPIDSRAAAVARVYEPVHAALDRLEFDDLIRGVDTTQTGWPAVDELVRKLRARFRGAGDPQDLKAVGLLCEAILQALGRAVFDPAQHLSVGEAEPGVDDAKRRIEFYVLAVTRGRGSNFRHIRALVAPLYGLSEGVKHHREPSCAEARVAADGVLQLVGLVRSISG